MPKWLKHQLMKAYLEKNINQIKMLNQCWYVYRKKHC
ncbi:cortex morphogenetic protein CmpA [Pontibacillus litoralis]|uniref:Cortex morphogenetic protein CmpA n=1 Tax=Pontibacillus litoralis JSM 072002 TaxID=1385512 RepID=A0A0A5G648_9BACI|nr:cortex morphogenetic protein CmpA [Pontibacillus litoralis]KGX86555.1 hypothetical protein N784_04055 [Pontibacillus litoralis JSM 072002]